MFIISDTFAAPLASNRVRVPCRAKFSTVEARILELEEQMTNLEEEKAAAEAAVQEHLGMREKQTVRIRKAKAGGIKGEYFDPIRSPPPHPKPCFLNPSLHFIIDTDFLLALYDLIELYALTCTSNHTLAGIL